MIIYSEAGMEKNRQLLFPNGTPPRMNSSELFFDSPEKWATTFQRLLRSALVSQDEDLFRQVLDEYAAVVGIDITITEVIKQMDLMLMKIFQQIEKEG